MPRAKRITRKYSGLKKIKKKLVSKNKKSNGKPKNPSKIGTEVRKWKNNQKKSTKTIDPQTKFVVKKALEGATLAVTTVKKKIDDEKKKQNLSGSGTGTPSRKNNGKGKSKGKSKSSKAKKVSAITAKKLTTRQRVINAALAGGLGSGLKYKAAAKAAQKKDKKYRTNSKYNSYYQMIDCALLKQMNGTPEKDLEVYNKLLEIDQETKTMIADLQNITKQGDTNLATVKAGINSLMKNELNEVTFNVGGTAPLYEMIYHINENLNEHIKENSFSTFQKNFVAAANKHAKVEMDYFQEYTKLVYSKMGRELKENEVKYNAFAKSHASNSDVKQTYTIPEDGKYSTRFRLVSGAEVPVADRDSYTLIKENTYGPIVNNKNEVKKKYAPIRANAKKLSGTIK